MNRSIIFENCARQFRAHPNLSMWLILFFVVALGYAPAINTYFISDDYLQLSYLFFNAKEVLNGNQWRKWFLGFIDAYVYSRPVTYAFTFVDFIAWGIQPQGYHVTRFALHWLASFVVYLIAWQMVHRRLTALVVSLFFAILPIHATAVSWLAATTDIVCGFWILNKS